MPSVTLEAVAMWAAVTLYAAGGVAYVVGLMFRKERVTAAATWVSLLGLVPHLVGIGVRWTRVGHGPYLGFYEVISTYALFAVVAFALVSLRFRGLRPAGIFVMPLVFLFLGGAMLTSPDDLPLTGTLASYWLIIHVTFAKLAYGSFIASFALALSYVVRGRARSERWTRFASRFPSQETVDDLSYSFVAAGFVFLAVMIAAGAVWANEAWGRYWGWDPIETWALVSWLVYAVALHLRLTLRWRGDRWAWVVIAALPTVLFALIGVPIVYQSIHGAYLTGY